MLTRVIPQLLTDPSEGRMHYIQDRIKAAVIMLQVYRKFQIRLENGELARLCTMLCLPHLGKEDFLQYWTQFSQEVGCVKK